MKVTYYGHSCFGVEVGGKNVLFDPFVTPNPLAASVDVDSIPADYVLISHGHEDHVADAESILKRTGAKLISNFEIVTWFGGKGIETGHPLNHGGGTDTEFGRVEYVNAVHSSVLPDGTYGGNPGGFVVISNDEAEGCFYYSGDTALHYDMKLLGECLDLDWAAMCIGDNFTMGYRGALKAAEFAGVNKVLGLHYDTFPPIEIDREVAVSTWKGAGRELVLAGIGETVEM